MALKDMFLGEFDQEMASTRRTLERVPEDKFTWKPHEKSFTMQELASHLANVCAWTPTTLKQDSFDVAPVDSEPFTPPKAESVEHLLNMFDDNVKTAREAIASTTDEEFNKNWSLLSTGREVLSMPRVTVLRTFIFNHNVHHRGQLTVYLRLNDVPVPAIYGQSADEKGI